MEERYIRNIGAITADEQLLLATKKIFVAGGGGLGCHITDMLLRIGIGELRTADADCFAPSNLNRQLYADMSTIGRSKVEVAAERAAQINPEVLFKAYNCFIDSHNVSELISGCDAVMDALDSIPSRLILQSACEEKSIPLIHGAVAGWNAQTGISMPGDRLISKIYPADADELPQEPASVLSFVPAFCASLQTALAVSLLCGRPVETGVLHCCDLSDMAFMDIRLS